MLEDTKERVLPPHAEQTLEDYLVYLKHVALYEFAVSQCTQRAVLDLGCGEGYGGAMLARTARLVIAADNSLQVVSRAAVKYACPNLGFVVCDAQHLPFGRGAFDTIISFEVIEHLIGAREYLDEAHRVCTGTALISTPNRVLRLLPFQKPWNRFHVHEYDSVEFGEILRTAFPHVQVRGITASPTVLDIEKRRVRQNPLTAYPRMLAQLFLPRAWYERLRDARPPRGNSQPDEAFDPHGFSVQDFTINTSAQPDDITLLGVCQTIPIGVTAPVPRVIPPDLRRNLSRALTRWFVSHPFKGSLRVEGFLCRLLLPSPQGPTVVRTLYDFDLVVDPSVDRGLEEWLYYRGTYEPGTLWVIEKCLAQGDAFIDVGSNIGLISIFASHRVGTPGRVYSFEPDPATFPILRDNVDANHIQNTSIYPVALGAANGARLLYRNVEFNRGASSFIQSSDSASEGVQVEIWALDHFLAETPLPNLKMIKVDVEGWEHEVLKGAEALLASPHAPILCVEYDKSRQAANPSFDVYRYILSVNRYTVFKLRRGKESISRLVRVRDAEELPAHDNLFCFLDNHLAHLPSHMFG